MKKDYYKEIRNKENYTEYTINEQLLKIAEWLEGNKIKRGSFQWTYLNTQETFKILKGKGINPLFSFRLEYKRFGLRTALISMFIFYLVKLQQ